MDFSHLDVVVDDGNDLEDVDEEGLPAETPTFVSEDGTNAKLGDGDGGDGHVVIVVDDRIQCVARTFGADQQRGVEEEAAHSR